MNGEVNCTTSPTPIPQHIATRAIRGGSGSLWMKRKPSSDALRVIEK
jgi:hypothetical protein